MNSRLFLHRNFIHKFAILMDRERTSQTNIIDFMELNFKQFLDKIKKIEDVEFFFLIKFDLIMTLDI